MELKQNKDVLQGTCITDPHCIRCSKNKKVAPHPEPKLKDGHEGPFDYAQREHFSS
jgi:hypothetical protein